jgi:small subunit ribosomal protein S4e
VVSTLFTSGMFSTGLLLPGRSLPSQHVSPALIPRLSNIFVIGEGAKAQVSLPKGKGVKLSIAEERDQRRRARAQEA